MKYFRERYVKDGEINKKFDTLKLRKPNKKIVEDVLRGLRGYEPSVERKVFALLNIVYRLRNNLFHGTKWASGIRDQKDNFEHSTKFLMCLLEATQARE